jgi:hypothetical protein
LICSGRELHRDESAHAQADRGGAFDAEPIEQRHHVGGEISHRHGARRRRTLAVAAQVRGDDPEARVDERALLR